MTLREELIDRLGNRLEKSDSGDGYRHVPYGLMLSIVADECIRQMEWARTQDKVLYLHHGGATVGSPPLTLAPDDWRAE